jgi:hypothetical protein
MSTDSVTTRVIDGYLRLLRRPIDFGIARLPDGRSGPRAIAQLAVDRLDASVRGILGAALRDGELRWDAERRDAAASERELALKLRSDAAAESARAEANLEQRHEKARRRREQAKATAEKRRRQAAATQRSRTRVATTVEQQRLERSRQREAAAAERRGRDASEQRLNAAEETSQALKDREQAAGLQDRAEQLGEVAANAKLERKSE